MEAILFCSFSFPQDQRLPSYEAHLNAHFELQIRGSDELRGTTPPSLHLLASLLWHALLLPFISIRTVWKKEVALDGIQGKGMRVGGWVAMLPFPSLSFLTPLLRRQ